MRSILVIIHLCFVLASCWTTNTNKLKKPVYEDVYAKDLSINVEWSATEDFDSFILYYGNQPMGWKNITSDGKTESITFNVTSVGKYHLKLAGIKDEKQSAFNEREVTVKVNHPFIESLDMEDLDLNIEWSSVNNFDSYEIFYNNETGNRTKLIMDGNITSTRIALTDVGNYEIGVAGILRGYKTNYGTGEVKVTLFRPIIQRCSSEDLVLYTEWSSEHKFDSYELIYNNESGDRTKLILAGNMTSTRIDLTDVGNYDISLTGILRGYRTDYFNKKIKVSIKSPEVKILSLDNMILNIEWRSETKFDSYEIFYSTNTGKITKLCLAGNETSFSAEVTDVGIYEIGVAGELRGYTTEYYYSKIQVDVTSPIIDSLTSEGLELKIDWFSDTKFDSYELFYKNENGYRTKLVLAGNMTSTVIDLEDIGEYTVGLAGNLKGHKTEYVVQQIKVLISSPMIEKITSDNDLIIDMEWSAFNKFDSYELFYYNENGNRTKLILAGNMTSTSITLDEAGIYEIGLAGILRGYKTKYTNMKMKAAVFNPTIVSLSAENLELNIEWSSEIHFDSFELYCRSKTGNMTTYTLEGNLTTINIPLTEVGTYEVGLAGNLRRHKTPYSIGQTKVDVKSPEIAVLFSKDLVLNIEWNSGLNFDSFELFYNAESGDRTKLILAGNMTSTSIDLTAPGTYEVGLSGILRGHKTKDKVRRIKVFAFSPVIESLTSEGFGFKIEWSSETKFDSYELFYNNERGDRIKLVLDGNLTSTSIEVTDVGNYQIGLAGNLRGYTTKYSKEQVRVTAHQPKFVEIDSDGSLITASWETETNFDEFKLYWENELKERSSITINGSQKQNSFNVTKPGTYELGIAGSTKDYMSSYSLTTIKV